MVLTKLKCGSLKYAFLKNHKPLAASIMEKERKHKL